MKALVEAEALKCSTLAHVMQMNVLMNFQIKVLPHAHPTLPDLPKYHH